MQKRDHWLVDLASFVIAVYNGSQKGGTAYTVNYARQKKQMVILIDPDTCRVTPYKVSDLFTNHPVRDRNISREKIHKRRI